MFRDTPLTSALLAASLMLPPLAAGADMPVREVILYKHGVGYFERRGDLKPGDTIRLDFKASEMNDVLKSLTLTGNVKVAGVRYDAADPASKRLEDFPFRVGEQVSLASFLDQMKGAELELMIGTQSVSGTIVSARTRAGDKDHAEQQLVVLLTNSGEIRTYDLGATTGVKLTDPKLQSMLRDYLAVLGNARSRERRNVYIDAGNSSGQIAASYMTPAAVWKSSYRLIFGTQAQPLLEGWAIVDNTSGEDWSNVKLSVVSGRPISFITQLYEPRYVTRPTAELAENQAVAPVVFEGNLKTAAEPAPPPAPRAAARLGVAGGFLSGQDSTVEDRVAPLLETGSTINATAQGRDTGELFEYSFEAPVTIKQGESAMLPFLQQRLGARKLLIYSENFGLHPMNAAELTNSTGKTLDGGPITVYDANTYAGEALVETLKAGDKRLISYGVDLGTRVSTAWDSSRADVREIHVNRGVLTTRNAVLETKTYTLHNVDAMPKVVIIEHAQRPGFKLLDLKPTETTSAAYRFEVKLAANATAEFPVKEERVYDQTLSLTSMTPDILATWLQNKALSDAGRQQLQAIAAKKRQITDSDSQLRQVTADINTSSQDQGRLRQNIESLRSVAGQQEQVQQYARQLAANEANIAKLRDSESQLRKQKAAFEAELGRLIENAQF